MPDDEKMSADVPMDVQHAPLPPVFEKFLADLKADRKRLLRDKGFENAVQLRAYLGQFLYPRLDEMIRGFGQAIQETYALAFSNTSELRRLHRFTVDELNHLGADIDDDVPLPGVSVEVLNEFQEAFYALGTHLQAKYPNDEDTSAAFNRVAETVTRMVEELMEGQGYDDDDDDREPDDEDDDREAGDDESGDDAEDSEEAQEGDRD